MQSHPHPEAKDWTTLLYKEHQPMSSSIRNLGVYIIFFMVAFAFISSIVNLI
ncbi:MAG: hypothetical protein IKI28_06620 [Bacteroidales bacterium]|nr:hypothetical protein [Bacteroidales bacterium]